MKNLIFIVLSAFLLVNVQAHWQKIEGSLKQVSFGGVIVCGVNCKDEIFCKNNTN